MSILYTKQDDLPLTNPSAIFVEILSTSNYSPISRATCDYDCTKSQGPCSSIPAALILLRAFPGPRAKLSPVDNLPETRARACGETDTFVLLNSAINSRPPRAQNPGSVFRAPSGAFSDARPLNLICRV